jgi:mono/diheme cytochrome c family protein
MKLWKKVSLTLLLVVFVAAGFEIALIRGGLSARGTPMAIEKFLATMTRKLAIPSGYRRIQNPFSASPENIQAGMEHFADHCATCHANDGSGKTEIGQNLYPKSPDMRLPPTQNLSDGEIYYIIHNGVRLTGMPAWGEADHDPDSWKLVLFIRHLPQLTAREEKEMERYNPTSEIEREEKRQEEEFLNGEDSLNKKQNPHP